MKRNRMFLSIKFLCQLFVLCISINAPYAALESSIEVYYGVEGDEELGGLYKEYYKWDLVRAVDRYFENKLALYNSNVPIDKYLSSDDFYDVDLSEVYRSFTIDEAYCVINLNL